MMTEAADLLQHPFGRVWPHRPPQPLPDTDVRTLGLRRFREFLSVLRFMRPGNTPTQPIEYRLPLTSIHIEQPDAVVELPFPGVGILPGRGLSEPIGLGPPKPLEDTLDVYGAGTILVQQGEYTENFTVEAWGSHRAERRSLLAGISAALRLSEDSYSTRIAMPDYYDRVVEFWLDGQQHIDDTDVVKGRRRGHLFVWMRLAEVQLVNATTMQPLVALASCDVDADITVGVGVAAVVLTP